MFPGPNATVYRNEDGEPIGWSDESYYEPDPDDFYDGRYDYDDYDDAA